MKSGILITTLSFAALLFLAGPALASGYGQEATENQAGSVSLGQGQGSSAEAMQLDTDQVRQLQVLLQIQGYDVGSIDGIITPETTEALRAFQADEGLAVTGNPNQETLRQLAPNPEQQEFFGLSPEYGEQEKPMEKKPAGY